MKKIVFLLSFLWLSKDVSAQVTFYVHLDTSIHKNLRGRLYVYTQSDTSKPVPDGPDAVHPQPMFALNVTGWNRDQVMSIDKNAEGFPFTTDEMKPGIYKIGAVIDRDLEERGTFNPGNYYSRKDVFLRVNENGTGEAHLNINTEIRARKFNENDSLKPVELRSTLLSEFRKKDIFIKAGIKLPKTFYQDPQRTYPVVFVIPGWGGRYFDIQGSGPAKRYGMGMGKEKIYVYLDPESQTPFGLHAFVDSRVNGPWGKALVEELIPYLERAYRINTEPSQHFVIGQSTGGYGSLWLQLNYPKAFGGCWAVSPDPVDFTAFTGVNLYEKKANFYYDAKGELIPIFYQNGKAESTLKTFMDIETYIGDGEQQQSFEAEFGVLAQNGKPALLFDRTTGLIDATVVKSWRAYDMGLYIQNNWKKLAASLKDKVHIYAGAEDNFLLNRSVEALAKKARSVNAEIVAEIIPESNHWTIWNRAFTERVQKEIDERIK